MFYHYSPAPNSEQDKADNMKAIDMHTISRAEFLVGEFKDLSQQSRYSIPLSICLPETELEAFSMSHLNFSCQRIAEPALAHKAFESEGKVPRTVYVDVKKPVFERQVVGPIPIASTARRPPTVDTTMAPRNSTPADGDAAGFSTVPVDLVQERLAAVLVPVNTAAATVRDDGGRRSSPVDASQCLLLTPDYFNLIRMCAGPENLPRVEDQTTPTTEANASGPPRDPPQ